MESILVKLAGLLVTGLKLGATSLVGRAMAGIGLTWVNFTYALPTVKSWVSDKFTGLPPNVTQFLAATGVDIFMTLIISAIVARVGMRTITTSLTALEGLIGQEQGT
ncbi:DUF2523 family protein [Pseudoxanthomonas sp. SE1]|uniref:DUF2523 family protein n=1 Tax=Pseudoxanthomonas sp. SE1 TaxID=1664560 RepID=UPI00240D7F89|nr:DUF2523 family protein [Pseudoxanthomonas sp. SE1]WFC43771.1 DUF2523 family protein [Pseudoxanthomonas sp. SE1]